MMSQQPKHWKIILIGDSCTDEYVYGNVNRISPEAPIQVLDFVRRKIQDGMTKNVRNNLVNLNCDVNMYTKVLEQKTRYIDEKSNQQLIRVDSKINYGEPYNINVIWPKEYDAVVICDYDKGYLSYDSIEHIISKSNKPVFIDTKKQDLARFKGAYIKINKIESDLATSKTDDIIVTQSGINVTYKDNEFYPPDVGNLIDACGAGDTFLAALVKKFLDTNDMAAAINFAMIAAAVTVKHTGTYAPTIEEMVEI
jgi:D-beta-D-heptose 7-phosphate kinase/D-beta-D-heptose 1-phosphate adenosyltransferase